MIFMGNFEEDIGILIPVSLTYSLSLWITDMCVSFQQIDAVIAAATSVTSSEHFKKVLEVQ